MPRKPDDIYLQAWTLDQLAKSAFFHRKLHEWKLLEIAVQIEAVRGEGLSWENFSISETAWNKVIHRGIKPVMVFANPEVLKTVNGSVGYYRMLAMVSQKSMKRVGISLDSYEDGKPMTNHEMAISVANHLNHIISTLIETEEILDPREFDLWRGMAAGSQAQGSWQNNKGASAEIAVREVILRRLQERGIISGDQANNTTFELGSEMTLVFSDEPDIAIYKNSIPLVAVEIKGGIDPAGVLERVGAALKSLRRTKQENPSSITILILQDVSLTERARKDLSINLEIVTHLYSTSSILSDEEKREEFFTILGI